MKRRWPLPFFLASFLAAAGCAHTRPRPDLDAADGPTKADRAVSPALHQGLPSSEHAPAMAHAIGPAPVAPELTGPQPVDAYIRRALAENRTVRAAYWNVMAMRSRIPQVTSLEDPVVSNTIFPIPAVGPQYSLMGYMPYDAMIAQQFPWFGTLRLRGQAAEADVKVALMELAAAQLDTVSAVKRAYHDLAFNQRSEALLLDNRALTEDFLKLARERAKSATATQVDVLRAETAISDIDRELEAARGAIAEARAALARELHVSPESELKAMTDLPTATMPAEIERLYQLAVVSRPDLKGRLAAIARDEKAIELARKRYYPNVTLGLVYQDMEKRNAESPTASGVPNVGMFVGFNLPVYRKKLAAGVCEAQARAAADAQLYEAERDQAHRDIKDLFTQAKVQQNVLALLNRTNLPNARQVLKLTASEFTNGNVDALALITAQRDLLQVQLQVAQVEAELAKTLASLERAVGTALNENPPRADSLPTSTPPPPPEGSGPFGRPGQATEPAERESKGEKSEATPPEGQPGGARP